MLSYVVMHVFLCMQCSSLRSFTKSRDVSGRRVSFGPVHEYHPDDHKPLDDVVCLVIKVSNVCPPNNLYACDVYSD